MLALAPNCTPARCAVAHCYALSGRIDEALKEFGDSIALDPDVRFPHIPKAPPHTKRFFLLII